MMKGHLEGKGVPCALCAERPASRCTTKEDEIINVCPECWSLGERAGAEYRETMYLYFTFESCRFGEVAARRVWTESKHRERIDRIKPVVRAKRSEPVT